MIEADHPEPGGATPVVEKKKHVEKKD